MCTSNDLDVLLPPSSSFFILIPTTSSSYFLLLSSSSSCQVSYRHRLLPGASKWHHGLLRSLEKKKVYFHGGGRNFHGSTPGPGMEEEKEEVSQTQRQWHRSRLPTAGSPPGRREGGGAKDSGAAEEGGGASRSDNTAGERGGGDGRGGGGGGSDGGGATGRRRRIERGTTGDWRQLR